MVLELHVWSPAFSLPSIDPQCLASIVYLLQAVPEGEWSLVPSNTPDYSPTKQLPALRNKSTWIGGFRSIVEYIREYSQGRWDLDSTLGQREKADCIAYSTSLEANGHPLLDLSLFVSSQNYNAVTRPAYATALTLSQRYLFLPQLRDAAKARSDHLGLSSLDVDAESSKQLDNHTQATSVIPPSLLTEPKDTVTSLLKKSPNAGLLRLDSLSAAFFEPLRDLLGRKRYFLSESQPSSLDCLAYGYLSLILHPELPQPWFADTMRREFGSLCEWVHGFHATVLGQFGVDEAGNVRGTPSEKRSTFQQKDHGLTEGTALPWQRPDAEGIPQVAERLITHLATNLPWAKELGGSPHIDTTTDGKDMTGSNGITANADKYGQLYTPLAAFATSAVALIAYLTYRSTTNPLHEQGDDEAFQVDLSELGEAGAALSVLTDPTNHNEISPGREAV